MTTIGKQNKAVNVFVERHTHTCTYTLCAPSTVTERANITEGIFKPK